MISYNMDMHLLRPDFIKNRSTLTCTVFLKQLQKIYFISACAEKTVLTLNVEKDPHQTLSAVEQ